MDFPGSETLLPGHGVESSGPYPAAEATAVTPTAPEQNKEQGTTTQEGGEDDGYGYDLAMSGAIQVGGPGPSSRAPYYSTDHQLAAALQEHEERIAASDSVYSYPVDAPPGEFPSQPCYYSDEPPPVEKYQIRPPPPKFDPWAIGHKRENKITQVKICQDCTEVDSVVGPVIYVQALGMWLCNYCGNQRLHVSSLCRIHPSFSNRESLPLTISFLVQYGSQQAGQATQKFQGGGSNRSSKNGNGKGKS